MPNDHPTEPTFGIEFEPTHVAASRARRTARDFLDGSSLSPSIVADLELVVAELASNAVDHGAGAPVRLTIAIDPTEAVVTVTNETTGAAFIYRSDRDDEGDGSDESDGGDEGRGRAAMSASHPLAERGRGLTVVEAVTDEVLVDDNGGWTTVSCRRRLDHPAG